MDNSGMVWDSTAPAGGGIAFVSTLDNTQLKQGVAEAKSQLRSVGQSVTAQSGQIDAAFKRIGAGIAGAFSVTALAQFAAKVADVRGEFQELQLSFQTMLGSKQKADALMSQMVDLAAKTPMSLEDVSESAKQLLAYGMSADKVTDTLKRLGDIASGLNINLKDLAWLYGTTMVQGRMYTQDLRQFLNRGIPMTDELAKVMHVSTQEVQSLVSAGKVGFPQVQAAIEDMTNTGGKFAGLMEAQSKTITGRISNLKDSITEMLNDIGKQTEGPINDMLDLADSLISHWKTIAAVLEEVVVAFGTYKAALLVTAAAEKAVAAVDAAEGFLKLAKSVGIAKAAMQSFGAATAAAGGWVTIILEILAVLGVAIYNHIQKQKEAYEQSHAAQIQAQQTAAKINEYAANLQTLDRNSKAYNDSLAKMNAIMKETGQSAIQEGASIDEINQKRTEAIRILNAEAAAKQRVTNIKSVKQQEQDSFNSAYSTLQNALRASSYGWLNWTGTASTLKKYGDSVAEGIGMVVQENLDKIAGKTGEEYKKGVEQIRRKILEELEGMGIDKKIAEKILDFADVQYYIKQVHDATLKVRELTAAQNQEAVMEYRASVATGSEQDKIRTTNKYIDSTINAVGGLTEAIRYLIANFGHNVIDFDIVYNGQVPAWMNKMSDSQLAGSIKAKTNALMRNPNAKGYRVASGVIDSKTLQTQIAQETRVLDDREAKRAAHPSVPKPAPTPMPSGGGGASDARERAKEAAQEAQQAQVAHLQRLDQEAQYAKDLETQQRQNELDLRQQKIDLLEDGYEKQKEQIDLNYDRLVQQNKDREEEMVNALRENEFTKWLDKNPKASELDRQKERDRLKQSITADDLSEGQKKALKGYADYARNFQTDSITKLYNSILDKYKGLKEKQLDLDKKYAEDTKLIQEDASLTPEQKKTRTAELRRQQKQSNQELNDQAAQQAMKDSPVITKIMGDTSQMGYRQLEDAYKEGMEFYRYLRETPADKLTPKFNMSASDLAAIAKSPEQMKALNEQLQRMKQSAEQLNPFKALGDAIKELFNPKETDADGNKVPLDAKLRNLGAAASVAADDVSGITGKLSQMFEAMGNDKLAGVMDGVTQIVDSIGNVAKGFAQGGLIGGIISAAGEAISWITKVFQAEKIHREALRKIRNEQIAQERAYQMAILETNLAMKQSETIFGNLDYSKALNAVTVMRDAYRDLDDAINGVSDGQGSVMGLNDVQIVTGHKKGGLFRHAKDLYSPILEKYPQLIDAQGRLNEELAKSILDSERFNQGGKEALQNIVNLNDEAKKAADDIQSYLSNIFGDLGKDITDSLVDAFENGSDAAEAFGKDVSAMIENLVKQMAFESTLGTAMQNASDSVKKILEDGSMSGDAKIAAEMNVIKGFVDAAKAQIPSFDAMLKAAQQEGKKDGFDLFKETDTRSSRSGSEGGIENVTQDSVNEVNGRVTAIQSHTYSIMANTKILVSNTSNILLSVRNIDRNTTDIPGRLSAIESETKAMRRSIGDMQTKGIKIKQ